MIVTAGKLAALGTLAVLALALAAATAAAQTGTNPHQDWPAAWRDPETWDAGFPQQHGAQAWIGQQRDGTPVDDVVIELQYNNAVGPHMTVTNGAVLTVRPGAALQMHNLSCEKNAKVDLSSYLVTDQFILKDGGQMTLHPGAHHRHRAGGARIGQGAGGLVVWTISGGAYDYNGSEFLVGEQGASAIINQSGGVANLATDLAFHNTPETANKWYIWGGQLVVTGNGEDPQDYVRMVNHGAPGGIVLSAAAEVYVRGDRTGDLTLIDSDGDALLTGAQYAEFGDWMLLDGTAISGYTRFRATASPTDTRTGENSDP